MRFPDDAEVSNELWGEVIECIKLLVADKVSAVRTSAVRALSRFANDSENRDIIDLFLEKLPLELTAAFVPVIRSLWPGINRNAAGSTVMVSNMCKHVIQASLFMLQMMQVPLYAKETATRRDNMVETKMVRQVLPSILRVERKALRYALWWRILILLNFRTMEQDAIKLMRKLLNRIIPSMAVEKDTCKELRQTAECLQSIDRNPDERLSHEQAHLILGKLGLEMNLNESEYR